MKRFLFAACAASALFATSALALPSTPSDINTNTNVNYDSSTAIAGAQAGASAGSSSFSSGGDAKATGGSATGGSVTNVNTPITTVSPDIRNTTTTTVSPTNTNTVRVDPTNIVAPVISPHQDQGQSQIGINRQGQGQGQGQHQSSSSTSAGGSSNQTQSTSSSATTGASTSSVSDTSSHTSTSTSGGNTLSDVHEAQARNPVSTAVAPFLSFSSDTCYASASAGGQGVAFGLSLGIPFKDKACEARANARTLQALGEREAAIQYLSSKDPDISRAVTAARTPK